VNEYVRHAGVKNTPADAASKEVDFFNGEVAIVNGFQLRDLGLVAVPTPAAALGGLALLPLVYLGRRKLSEN